MPYVGQQSKLSHPCSPLSKSEGQLTACTMASKPTLLRTTSENIHVKKLLSHRDHVYCSPLLARRTINRPPYGPPLTYSVITKLKMGDRDKMGHLSELSRTKSLHILTKITTRKLPHLDGDASLYNKSHSLQYVNRTLGSCDVLSHTMDRNTSFPAEGSTCICTETSKSDQLSSPHGSKAGILSDGCDSKALSHSCGHSEDNICCGLVDKEAALQDASPGSHQLGHFGHYSTHVRTKIGKCKGR